MLKNALSDPKIRLIVMTVLILGVCFSVYRLLFVNIAAEASAPIELSIRQDGAKLMCSNGDAGKGLDNTSPWYQAYYSSADDKALLTKLSNTLTRNGFTISSDGGRLEDWKKGAYGYGDGSPSNSSEYLIADRGDIQVNIAIFRESSVPLYCDNVEPYGKSASTGNGVIINVSTSKNS